MFGRPKAPGRAPGDAPEETSAAAAVGAGQEADAGVGAAARAGGKGRPTPRRREAEQANRRPLVGAAQVQRAATKEERKAAKAEQRARQREERLRMRAAMLSGDERHLPARDRGPVRRFVRDYVDARRNLGEFFLPVALVAVAISVINLPITKIGSLVLLYAMVIMIAVDSFLLRRRIRAVVAERFGADAVSGTGGYAIMRALQLRRGRLPRPQVKHGEYPAS